MTKKNIFLLAASLTLSLFSDSPVRAETFGVSRLQETNGSGYTTVINRDGELLTWGRLSDGTLSAHDNPIKIMEGASHLSAGEKHTLILKDNGSVWAFGSNDSGQLGDGTYSHRDTPVMIMEGAVAIAAGANHSLAVKKDNSLWAWGENDYGQLGGGQPQDNIPSPVRIMEDVSSVSAGSQFTAAVKTDASLWTWGRNTYGQLGDGSINNSAEPVKIMNSVISVSAGAWHAAAIKTDNTLWTWGSNRAGQLGQDNTDDNPTPTKIMDDVKDVSAGNWHSAVIKLDNTLWTWGRNNYGQLGDGTGQDRSTPAYTMDHVTAVYAGTDNTIAESPDGRLRIWGYCDDNLIHPLEGSQIAYISAKEPKSAATRQASLPAPRSQTSPEAVLFDPNVDGYSFPNHSVEFGYAKNYKIDLSTWTSVLGANRGKHLYDNSNESWQGNCFGMAATALMFYKKDLTSAYYASGAETVYEIPGRQKPGSPITKLIERYQVMQYIEFQNSPLYNSNYNNVDGFIKAMQDYQLQGNDPVVLCFWGNGLAHAAVPYRIEETDDGYQIALYDSLAPGKETFVTIPKDWKQLSDLRFSQYPDLRVNSISFVKESIIKEAVLGELSQKGLMLSASPSVEITNAEGIPLQELAGAQAINGLDDTFSTAVYSLPPSAYHFSVASSPGKPLAVIRVSNTDQYIEAETGGAEMSVSLGDEPYVRVTGLTEEIHITLTTTMQGYSHENISIANTAPGIYDFVFLQDRPEAGNNLVKPAQASTRINAHGAVEIDLLFAPRSTDKSLRRQD